MADELPKRITIRVTEKLHRAVKAKAAKKGTSLQIAVTALLEKWLSEEGTAKDDEQA